jgi:hypothetical protein
LEGQDRIDNAYKNAGNAKEIAGGKKQDSLNLQLLCSRFQPIM